MIECVHNTKPLTDIDATRLLEILKKRWGVFKSSDEARKKCSRGGYLVLNTAGDQIFGYSNRPNGDNFNIIDASSLLQTSIKYNKDLK